MEHKQDHNTNSVINTVVFDLGGVLIDWNPRHLYRKIFRNDENGMETFLTKVCHSEWNLQQDRGRPWKDAIDEAISRFPEHAPKIRAYRERWGEMLGGSIQGTVEILKELKSDGLKLLALTNWSAATFPIAEKRFAFLEWFDGIVVSGREKLAKPDPAIFKLLIHRYHLEPSRTVFIDDQLYNVEAAEKEGFIAFRFSDPERLRLDLSALGISLNRTLMKQEKMS